MSHLSGSVSWSMICPPSCARRGGSTLIVALFIFLYFAHDYIRIYLTLLVFSGCDITRLEALINTFYRTTGGQRVDASLFAFAWSIILKEPSVYVGTLPPGDHSEVYVAPPPRGGKKDAGKVRETTEGGKVASLEPVKDSKSLPLEQLRQLYGKQLRIAVDSGVVRLNLAGPHARVSPKWSVTAYIYDIPQSSTLSPMVYTVLQFVARARETGISTVDLSNETGYDSKNCAYLIKQLQEMDLVYDEKF